MTKKEFINSLVGKYSTIITAGGKGATPLIFDEVFIKKCEDILINKSHNEWRKCVKQASNHLTFSDGSSVYFNQNGKHKYYMFQIGELENFLNTQILVMEQQSVNTDRSPFFSYIIYAIK